MSETNPCPCCSNKAFHECCQPIIDGNKSADTPEALMRSRYTAYTFADIDYIQRTMLSPASDDFDPVSARFWASTAQWTGLRILRTGIAGDDGYVEFAATYRVNSQQFTLHEYSLFKRINNRWYYTDHKEIDTPGRNEPCYCGSGKKYKKCCGN